LNNPYFLHPDQPNAGFFFRILFGITEFAGGNYLGLFVEPLHPMDFNHSNPTVNGNCQSYFCKSRIDDSLRTISFGLCDHSYPCKNVLVVPLGRVYFYLPNDVLIWEGRIMAKIWQY